MFDGSHRTSKREINLSGASASSRSSRLAHLKSAKQQRLARAEAKARSEAARLLQRCWRGARVGIEAQSRDFSLSADCGVEGRLAQNGNEGLARCGRKGTAIMLSRRYHEMVRELRKLPNNDIPGTHGSTSVVKHASVAFFNSSLTNACNSQDDRIIASKAASILAFRLSPPLLPFFAFSQVPQKSSHATGSLYHDAEQSLRQDLLLLESLVEVRHGGSANDTENAPWKFSCSKISARRIVSIIFIILRQSFNVDYRIHTPSNESIRLHKRRSENERLVRLLDFLLESGSFASSYSGSQNDFWAQPNTDIFYWSKRPSDYFMNVISKGSSRTSLSPGVGTSSVVPNNSAVHVKAVDTLVAGKGTIQKNSFNFMGQWALNLFLCFRDSLFLSSESLGRPENFEKTGDVGAIYASDKGLTEPMDVDNPYHDDVTFSVKKGKTSTIDQTLLKWCCHVVINLAKLDVYHTTYARNAQKRQSPAPLLGERMRQFSLPLFEQGLALLSSILFGSLPKNCNSQAVEDRRTRMTSSAWFDDPLSSCLRFLKDEFQTIDDADDILIDSIRNYSHSSSSSWSPIFTYSLARSIGFLQTVTCLPSPSSQVIPATSKINIVSSRWVPGLKKHFSFPSSTMDVCDSNIVSDGNSCAISNYPWMVAIRDTLTSRECVVMDEVLSYARLYQQQKQNLLFMQAAPMILNYTLQQQSELAILSGFAARGEDISSWAMTPGNSKKRPMIIDLTATTAAGVLHDDGEQSEDDSEGDDQLDNEMMDVRSRAEFSGEVQERGYTPMRQTQRQQPYQQKQAHTHLHRDTHAKGRYSRAELQTLPKLDTLYQSSFLRARKQVLEKLRTEIISSENAISSSWRNDAGIPALLSLAQTIGSGEWMQQLGSTLFSSTIPLPLPLRWQATEAFIGALATVIASSSGLKAGRNASSPFFAKLAFHDPLLCGLWACSARYLPLLSTPLSSGEADPFTLAFAYYSFSAFCDIFSHHLLAVNDDEFLKAYHIQEVDSGEPRGRIVAKELILALKTILNDLYWTRPVLASDITTVPPMVSVSFPPGPKNLESYLHFQRARLLLSGTKLWNSLYERWCRLYRTIQFCDEECWWFPQLSSHGLHSNNPIVQSQVTTSTDEETDDAMEESSVASVTTEDGDDVAAVTQRAANGTSLSTANTIDAGNDALAGSFRDPKMARVLTYIPHALPFSQRVNLFQSLLEADKLSTQDETVTFHQMMMNLQNGDSEGDFSGRERVVIRRDALYEDSMESLNPLGQKLRKKVQITFVNKHGATEAGIDGGGVFKEFLDDLIKDAFLPRVVRENDGAAEIAKRTSSIDFFSVTPLQTLQVNTISDGDSTVLPHFEFLGRVLGKAVYESILVDPQFCLPFLNKLLGKQNSLDDLKNLDPEYYRNLKSLRYMSAKEIDDLGLTFEITKTTATPLSNDGQCSTIELIPGGKNISVSKDNVIQYIHLVSHLRMNVSGSRQTHAFLRGFRDLIPASWVRLFSAYEFQKVISGDDTVKGIDVKGMMAVMRYSGGFHPSQPIVQWFWEVVEAMTPTQQRKFLKFMTSCSRQPLLGFQSLIPAPCIQQIRLRGDDRANDISEDSAIGNIRLPSSSTCMNLLKLPKYTSKEMLKQKLIYAIESAAGFELS